jgi:hypothetical protein
MIRSIAAGVLLASLVSCDEPPPPAQNPESPPVRPVAAAPKLAAQESKPAPALEPPPGWIVNRSRLGVVSAPRTQEERAKLIELGVKTIRVEAVVGAFKPDDTFPMFDTHEPIVDWARQNGIAVVYLLCYAPAWANAETRKKFGYAHNPAAPWEDDFCPPDAPAWWKKMSKIVMTRFKGKVFDYEVWNEANSGFYYRGHLSAEARQELTERYVQLCRATFEAAREVDPAIRVYTCGPHNDFFGHWMSGLFKLGVADWSDGLVLHIYSEPPSMASFDVWWWRYMQSVEALEQGAGKKFPLQITEYGYHKGAGGTPHAGSYALAQTVTMLASGRIDGLTRFHFYDRNPNENGYAIYAGSFEETDQSRTLRVLHRLFNDATYRPLAGASVAPPGDSLEVPGTPRRPDTKFHAFEVARADGTRSVLAALWRGRFDYGKNQLVDIPDQEVTVTLPGTYAKAEELGPDGNLSPFSGYVQEADRVTLKVGLEGIKGGKEGRARAFLLQRR